VQKYRKRKASAVEQQLGRQCSALRNKPNEKISVHIQLQQKGNHTTVEAKGYLEAT